MVERCIGKILTTMLDESGRPMPAQLDFCPDVLYQYSQEE